MKKVLSIVLTVFMIFGIVSLTAFAIDDEIEKTWTTSFDEKTGTLTVSGTGVVDGLYPLDCFAYNGNSYEKEENYDIKQFEIIEVCKKAVNLIVFFNRIKENSLQYYSHNQENDSDQRQD